MLPSVLKSASVQRLVSDELAAGTTQPTSGETPSASTIQAKRIRRRISRFVPTAACIVRSKNSRRRERSLTPPVNETRASPGKALSRVEEASRGAIVGKGRERHAGL